MLDPKALHGASILLKISRGKLFETHYSLYQRRAPVLGPFQLRCGVAASSSCRNPYCDADGHSYGHSNCNSYGYSNGYS